MLNMYVCLREFMCTMCMQVPVGTVDTNRCKPPNVGLGTQPRSSERTVSILNHRVTPVALGSQTLEGLPMPYLEQGH